MRTARLETTSATVSVATTRCHLWGAQKNKFEQVSSDHYQMPLAGGVLGLMAGGLYS